LSLAEENEERTMIDPTSREDPKFKELVKVRVLFRRGLALELRAFVGRGSQAPGLLEGTLMLCQEGDTCGPKCGTENRT
jgi:hypothetical protein